MATTIQVSEETKQLLAFVKKREQASSYDEVILHLAKEHVHVPASLFGSAKGLKWKKEDRLQFREL